MLLLYFLVWELDRPLQGPWVWQARPCTLLCMHSSLHPCLLKSQSHARNSAFPEREPDDLFSFSFCFQISILLVGSIDDRFTSEGSDLILQNCTVSNVIKEYLPVVWVHHHLSWIPSVTWDASTQVLLWQALPLHFWICWGNYVPKSGCLRTTYGSAIAQQLCCQPQRHKEHLLVAQA